MATFGLLSSARAEDAPADVVSAGYIVSWVYGDASVTGHGGEISYMHYPKYDVMQALGGFVQVQSYGGGLRWAAGGQAAWSIAGLELGIAQRQGNGTYGTTVGIHMAPYVSIGFLHLAFRVVTPITGGSDRFPLETGLTLGIKGPSALGEHWPDPIKIRVPSGRPLREGDAAKVASVSSRRTWLGDVRPRVAGLDGKARSERAARWLEDARMEHASIAAFSRLSLELMALGAPPELIESAHRAALDEVRHARLCFALASAYAGVTLSAGELPVSSPRSIDLARMAQESFLDGCLGEGRAAAVAREEASRCDDPAVRAVLTVIAREEQRHARLGWEIVEFCLERGGEPVFAALEETLTTLARLPADGMSAVELRARRRLAKDLAKDVKRRTKRRPHGAAAVASRRRCSRASSPSP